MFGLFRSKPEQVVTPAEALPGRDRPLYAVADRHVVNGQPLRGPWPGCDVVAFGMGCFWGAERKLWQTPGVVCTSVGYQGGHTPNPTYRETCTGLTGHVEVVQVAHDPARLPFAALLRVFWEGHDPTQGMRQGNDVGTVYRSAIYATTQAQLDAALASRDAYQARLLAAGYGPITTEIRLDPGPYWLAEDHHQQYLHKNPDGYCGLGGTGVSCPVGAGVSA